MSFEGLCKGEKAGQLPSPPQLPRQVGRTVPHGCTGRTFMGDALACQDPDRGRWEVFSGRETWGWLISVSLMLHTAAGEKKCLACVDLLSVFNTRLLGKPCCPPAATLGGELAEGICGARCLCFSQGYLSVTAGKCSAS